MTISTHLSRLGVAAALVAALSACSTTPKLPEVPQFQDMLAEASKAAASGDKEQAIALWKKGAEAYPKEKAPWSSIAQTRYEAGQYSEAIQAASEVLVRDPNDTLANSIIAVSGLRLSTRALGDLSRQNNLSGSVKSEAQELAKLLRTSLGEVQLLEAPKVTTTTRANADRAATRTGTRNTNRGSRNGTGTGTGTTRTTTAKPASDNPFDGLN